MALLLGDMPGVEQMELDSAGEVDRAGLAGFSGGEVAGVQVPGSSASAARMATVCGEGRLDTVYARNSA